MEKFKKSYVAEIALLIISIIMIVVGYFLWTILIPIQDIEMHTHAELMELQKELALNYPLGQALMLMGAIGILITVVLLVWKIALHRNT